MMKKIALPLLTVTLLASRGLYANQLDKLIKSNTVKNFEPIKIKRQELKLDDPYLVQAYGTLREKGIKQPEILKGFDHVFAKEYSQALTVLYPFKDQDFVKATLIYLSYRLDRPQVAIDFWVDQAKDLTFLDSQLAVALDQVMGKNASQWIIANGIYLDEQQRQTVLGTGNKNLSLHYSLQALSLLRQGEKGLSVISYLPETDPLRMRLAESLVLAYARKGELANAAKVLKGVFEPALEKVEDVEQISFYYLNLARLLYQAEALDAAWQYYAVIPDESRWFITAQVERMWISMHRKNFSQIKGMVKTLELDIFQDEFLPERHLVNAMANLQTCQFEKVKASMDAFIADNKRHAKAIEKNLAVDRPEVASMNNYYLQHLSLAKQKLGEQIKAMGKFPLELKALKQRLSLIEGQLVKEARRQWSSRKKILEANIMRMRFVKVEYLSTMRRLHGKLALMQKNTDKVSVKSAAIDNSDRVVFPFDGQFFSDELFNITSAVSNLCLQEKRK